MRFLILLLSLLYITCTSDNVAGGGIETTNGGTLIGNIAIPSGIYDSVTVTARPFNYNPAVDLKSEVFNVKTTDGSFKFENLPEGKWRLWSELDDTLVSSIVSRVKVDSTTIMTDSMKFVTGINMRSVVQNSGIWQVSLFGTDKVASVSGGTDFYFNNLPEDAMIARLENDTAVTDIQVKTKANLNTLVSKENNVVIDDFEDGDKYNSLWPIVSGGVFYCYTSLPPAEFDSITPVGIINDVTLGISDVDAFDGKSFGFKFNPPIPGASYAFLAYDLGLGKTGSDPYNTWFDLSDVSTIKFMAKGTGDLIVSIESKFITDNYSVAEHPEKTVFLSSDWTVIEIDVNELFPPDGTNAKNDNVSWDDFKDAISMISFRFDDAGDVMLDDIELVGVSLSEFIP